MNELKVLLTEGKDPCERSENKFLGKLIECYMERNDCMQCMWDKESNQHSKLLELIPIMEIEPDE